MMKNFVLLENEHDHTGSDRNGPLAAYDDAFKGRGYFHIRRVYRGVGGGWSPSGQGISCPADQRDALLAALRAFVAPETVTMPDVPDVFYDETTGARLDI